VTSIFVYMVFKVTWL